MFDSGITTLNLAITGHPDRFADSGNIVSYIGGSDAGKTILALTTQAASFYRYGVKPVFYAMEPNLEIDIPRLFGKKFSKELEVVCDLNMPLEHWQADARDRFKRAKKPISMVLDSTDAVKCVADLAAINGKKPKKQSASIEVESEEDDGSVDVKSLQTKGTKAKMGGEAAGAWSRCLGEVSKSVHSNQGLLILLSQIRTKPGVVFGSPFYRSGGNALDFHSELRVWLHGSTSEQIDKVKVGGWTRIEVKRNKVTGETRTIYAPIYPVYGIDDTRAMLHFLADTDSGASWANKSNMNSITVGDKTTTLSEMAAYFEGPETKEVLKQMVVDAWAKREAMLLKAVLSDRKPRFA